MTEPDRIYNTRKGGFRKARGWKQSEMDKFMEPDELRRLLQTCSDGVGQGRMHAQFAWSTIAIAGNLGLRCGETIGLRHDDFKHLRDNYLIVRTLKRRAHIEDRLYVGEGEKELLYEILEYHPGKLMDKLFRLGERSIRFIFAYYAKLAGLSHNLSFHALRHTAARMIMTAAKAVGDENPIRHVTARLRHAPGANQVMAMIYTTPSPAERIAVANHKGVIR